MAQRVREEELVVRQVPQEPPEAGKLRGYVAVVTGVTRGSIGYATAKELVLKGASVILAGRKERKEETLRAIKEDIRSTPGSTRGSTSSPPTEEDLESRLEFMELDLSSFSSVKNFVKQFKDKDTSLHILVNNAGIVFVKFDKTGDGYEKHFQVNYLGHFLLTLELQPWLKRGATEKGRARVVMVTSYSHRSAEFNPANMNGELHYSRFVFYHNSKLYQIMFAYSLQRRLAQDKIIVSCVYPGKTRTNFTRMPCSESPVLRVLSRIIINSSLFHYKRAGERVESVVSCTLPGKRHVSDMQYYHKRDKTVWNDKRVSKTAKNVRYQKQLWEISMAAVKEHMSENTVKEFSSVECEEQLLVEMARITLALKEGGREGGREASRDKIQVEEEVMLEMAGMKLEKATHGEVVEEESVQVLIKEAKERLQERDEPQKRDEPQIEGKETPV